MLLKIQNPILKYPVFVKTSKIQKNFEKKKILCIRPSVSKLKNHIVFFIHKKQCFSMHFGFNNQFIKVKRTLAKISKTRKILFCFVF
jgi:esterase/lipase superfamily enzyme